LQRDQLADLWRFDYYDGFVYLLLNKRWLH